MKKTFPGYFSNDPEILKDVWQRCLFVLDANVLLSLYRYSDGTRSELFEIFELLNDRLWVPHQVASEYLVNRVGVIGQQVKVYEDAIKNVEELRRSFENPKQHPFVQEETLKDSVATFDKIVSDLGDNKKSYLHKIEVDDVKANLESLLDGRVGRELTSEEVSEVLVSGAARYLQKIPPGYKDIKKGGDSDIVADKLKPFGDYIVWRQTIEKAKSDGLPVIFVTGDSKEDWWTIYSGKPLEPHPLLVDEFVREVGQSFFMYLPEKFMERANEYLDRATSQKAIDEIVDIRAEELAAAVTRAFNRGRFLLSAYTEEEKSSAKMEIELLDENMNAGMSQISVLELTIERLIAERQESSNRYTSSLSATNGVETPHSLRLSSVINQLSSDIEKTKVDLEMHRDSYNELALQYARARRAAGIMFYPPKVSFVKD